MDLNQMHKYLQENPEFVQGLSDAVSIETNKMIFDEFSVNPDKNKLMLKFMSGSQITLDNFKYMIDLGADPNDNMDKLLALALEHESTDIAAYLLDEYNAQIKDDLVYRLSINNFRMLLNRGLIITDMYIDKCFDWINSDKLELLLEHGVPLSKIMERFIIVPNNSLQYVIACHLVDKVTNSNEFFDPVLLIQFVARLINYDLSPRMYFSSNHPGRSKNILTVDLVQKFVSMGLDVHHDNDHIVLDVCALNDLSMVKFFVEDLGCDINAHDSAALIVAIRKSRNDTIEYLLDAGIKISDNTIHEIFIVHEPKLFQLLLKYYDNSELITQKYFLYKTQVTDILKTFVDNGVDITKMIANIR